VNSVRTHREHCASSEPVHSSLPAGAGIWWSFGGDGTVVLVGSTEITFSDYGVSVPEAPIVLSASDVGTLELQLFLQQS
jgi:hypothetical protein